MKICFHGAESTGKSTLARKLAREFGCPLVEEYGRTYAETEGTHFTLPDLAEIAVRQDRMIREGAARQRGLVLLDTDPLMTAAWAEMLFGTAPRVMFGYEKADLYFLFDADVPWVGDGTRLFGGAEERAHFASLAEAMLVRAEVPYERVSGGWQEREARVRDVLHQRLAIAAG